MARTRPSRDRHASDRYADLMGMEVSAAATGGSVKVGYASTGAGEATTRFAKASRGDMAAARAQQLSARSALRMPQCLVLQGCSRCAFDQLKDGRLWLNSGCVVHSGRQRCHSLAAALQLARYSTRSRSSY